MQFPRPRLIVLADAPDALAELGGVSLLERTLRVVQRLGFREVIILSGTAEAIRDHLTPPSWARAQVSWNIRRIAGKAPAIAEIFEDFADTTERTLFISANLYCDARLLKTMSERTVTTLLLDSSLPSQCAFLCNRLERNPRGFLGPAALVDRSWILQQDPATELMSGLAFAGDNVAVLDAAAEPTYLVNLRKDVRPVFFPAPTAETRAQAERIVQDAAQNGALDFPGLVHAPIETWLVSQMSRTAITPNQITFVTMLIGLVVTVLYATGNLWSGTVLALVVGVLDGVDGKLARTKVETTELGSWEHSLDYLLELSWWSVLAYHFRAYPPLLLLVFSDFVDRLAKRSVKSNLGRNLDDVSPLDRFVRFIGGRRNIYIWFFAAGLVMDAPRNAFTFFCWWGAGTAAMHLFRALQIRLRSEA